MTDTFTDIKAWQKAHEFVVKVYKTTRIFPDFEKYGLASQFQRAAVSIPANIAEGYRKLSKADKLRFMNIAQGSLEECRYYVILSKDLEYINTKTYEALNEHLSDTSRLLNAYCRGIKNNAYENLNNEI